MSSRLTAAARQKKFKSGHLHDIYAKRQADLRKEANLRRRALLREEEAKELGDPIRGKSTPFVESFDYAIPSDAGTGVDEANMSISKDGSSSSVNAALEKHLDHGLSHEELAKSLRRSRLLTSPLTAAHRPPGAAVDEAADTERWRSQDSVATEAVQRISSLANASSVHRTKKNIERIIETFGRHNTDSALKQRSSTQSQTDQAPTPRAGPDTGSSEVQIGILTAKIRVLADQFQGKARRDKMNKRNLRLLLHRRQKLLKYMERKERGSERWRHMIETLGLTPATWRGEIEVR